MVIQTLAKSEHGPNATEARVIKLYERECAGLPRETAACGNLILRPDTKQGVQLLFVLFFPSIRTPSGRTPDPL